jgi:hypothetical protein
MAVRPLVVFNHENENVLSVGAFGAEARAEKDLLDENRFTQRQNQVKIPRIR